MSEVRLQLPPKLLPVFAPARGELTYRGAYGGRGSGKSMTFAKMAAVWGVIEPLRILCVREIQASIKESFHAELKAAIESEPWLAAAYDVGVDYLRSRINRTEFLFKGLYRNLGSIKSMAKIDLTIVEEAEDTSEQAWLVMEATVLRTPKSEIWCVWNPKDEGSPVDTRFRGAEPAERSAIVGLNYTDNPWFPEGLELLRAQQKRKLDDATYQWIWEGEYLKNSSAIVFANRWSEGVRSPDTSWHGPYHGVDWGFSTDPTAAVRAWISPDGDELYVDKAFSEVGLELDDTARTLMDAIPGIERYSVIADSARPESISHVKRDRSPTGGKRPALPRIEAAVKGPGSVEDGIAHLKTYRIIVHPGCVHLIAELRKYSYKVDRLTGEVLPDLVDKHNHVIDALRYALEKAMRQTNQGVGMLFG